MKSIWSVVVCRVAFIAIELLVFLPSTLGAFTHSQQFAFTNNGDTPTTATIQAGIIGVGTATGSIAVAAHTTGTITLSVNIPVCGNYTGWWSWTYTDADGNSVADGGGSGVPVNYEHTWGETTYEKNETQHRAVKTCTRCQSKEFGDWANHQEDPTSVSYANNGSTHTRNAACGICGNPMSQSGLSHSTQWVKQEGQAPKKLCVCGYEEAGPTQQAADLDKELKPSGTVSTSLSGAQDDASDYATALMTLTPPGCIGPYDFGNILVTEKVPAAAGQVQGIKNTAITAAQNNPAPKEVANSAEKKAEITNQDPGDTDPVRLSTGVFYTAETDVDYGYLEQRIQIIRSFAGDNSGSRSFGTGWQFNFDTRLIMGLRGDIGTMATQLRRLSVDAWGRYNALMGEFGTAGQTMDTLGALADTFLGSAQAAQATAQDAYDRAAALGYQPFIDVASGYLQRADSLLSQANAEEQKIGDTRAELAGSAAERQSIADICAEIEALAGDADKENELGAYIRQKNRYVVGPGDPLYLTDTGFGTVTYIDEAGINHVYRLDQAPDYGSPGYYPDGSTTTPVGYADNSVELRADGRWVVKRKDGSTWQYREDGQIEKITDRNNNTVSFRYDGDHLLTEIKDGFGRSTILQRVNGRIAAVTDPAGRRFAYGYSGARLSSVTDAQGDTVRYEYEGDLLRRIVKPDGSYRQYGYTSLNGRSVTSTLRDEEGNTDQLSYDPRTRSTEFVNASGIRETR